MKFAVALCLLLCAIGVMTVPFSGGPRDVDSEEKKPRDERKQDALQKVNFGEAKRAGGDDPANAGNEAEFKRTLAQVSEYKRTLGGDEECEAIVTKWDDDKVYYAYCKAEMKNKYTEEAFATVTELLKGIINFEDVTNYQSYDCENSDGRNHFIAVSDAYSGCWSYIGKTLGTSQALNLHTGSCNSVYLVIHEIFHALGLYHQQQRPDAPQYITVNSENIKDGKEENFAEKTDMCTTCKYQTCSLMHYAMKTFSKGGETITPKDAAMGPGLGKQDKVQAGDLCAIYMLYDAREKENCKEVDGEGNDVCLWGTGNAYNFKCCRCPDHFTGDNCGTFEESDVAGKIAKSYEVTADGTEVVVYSPKNSAGTTYPSSTTATYFVSGPINCKIEMTAAFISVERENKDCYWDQFTYWRGESILDCPETICGELTNTEYTSKSNFYMVQLDADDMINKKGFELKFKAVNCN